MRQSVLTDADRPRLDVAAPVEGQLNWESYGPGDIVSAAYGSLDLDVLYAIATTTEQVLRGDITRRAFPAENPCATATFVAQRASQSLRSEVL